MIPNYDPWDELLRRYVDDLGRVDYRDWHNNGYSVLSDWLAGIAQIDLSSLEDSNQQLAFWLNLYNALTIAQVLEKYPIDSIRPQVLGLPNWIAFFWFFSRPFYQLDNQRYSLNKIEHGVLRSHFKEPRIHFALVCASIGCPLLRPEAYRPEQVQQQLSDDAFRFINNPDKVYYDAQTNTLYLSLIFRWYGQDFLSVAPSIPEYIQSYFNPSISLPSSINLKYFNYDWNLNQL